MKTYVGIALWTVISVVASAASSLEEKIVSEGFIVTKAELRRHMAAAEDDAWKPATYADLEASRDKQPNYLVVRFRSVEPAHYYGEAEAKINGANRGTKLAVVLHFNRGWVEYFVPLDGVAWPTRREGGPAIVVTWNSLKTK